MKITYLVLASLFSVASAVTQLSSPAWSGKIPFQATIEVNIDEAQPCKVYMAINKDRILTLRSKYSNGKKVDGDNFVSAAVFLDADGKPIFAAAHRAGLNAAGLGGATERTIDDYKTVDPDIIKRTSSISMICSTQDKYDDEEIAESVIKFLEAVFNSDRQGDPGSDADRNASFMVIKN